MRQFHLTHSNCSNLPVSLFLVCLIFLLGNASSTYAQEERVYRQFSTQAVDKQFRSIDTTVIERRQAIERYVKNYQLNGDLPQITIPVIFHHVYRQGRVSPPAIERQLNALNRAFSYETEWKHPAHDILGLEKLMPPRNGIQFCFADVDLMKNGAKGYNYVRVDVEEWTIDELVKAAISTTEVNGFDFTAYEPQNYLNIWIVDLPENEAGYAQMPWGPKKSDGIVINKEVFDPSRGKFSTYDQGKSLVHLIGSFLGLYELWSDNKPCSDDRVADTPIHNAPNYGANTEYRHISLCSGYPVAQTMNFMDATDDENVYFFTKGQMLRVAAMLSEGGPRGSLKDAQSLCSESLISEEAAARSNAITKPQKTSSKFQISPNPATNQITISYPADGEWQSFQLFNANGQLLQDLKAATGGDLLQVDCSHYPAGIYFITATSLSEKQTQRFTLSK